MTITVNQKLPVARPGEVIAVSFIEVQKRLPVQITLSDIAK